MLSRDGALDRRERLVDTRLDRLARLGTTLPDGNHQMQVSVSHVAEREIVDVVVARFEAAIDVREVGLHVGDAQAHVEGVDRRVASRVLNAVAQCPKLQALGFRLRDDRIRDERFFVSLG